MACTRSVLHARPCRYAVAARARCGVRASGASSACPYQRVLAQASQIEGIRLNRQFSLLTAPIHQFAISVMHFCRRVSSGSRLVSSCRAVCRCRPDPLVRDARLYRSQYRLPRMSPGTAERVRIFNNGPRRTVRVYPYVAFYLQASTRNVVTSRIAVRTWRRRRLARTLLRFGSGRRRRRRWRR